MNCFQIIFSPTGGVKKAARLVGGAWGGEMREIDLADAGRDFANDRFGGDDVCLVAVPSFGGRVPAVAAERLSRMTGGGAQAVLLCVFGNRAYDDTLLELKDVLTAGGFRCVAAVAAVAEHSIMHQFGEGRPDEQDQGELAAFSERIGQRLASEEPGAPLSLPGNKPYRGYHGLPLKPQTGRACNKCGLCASQCPTGAIDAQKPHETDSAKCITCMRCIAICPSHARALGRMALTLATKTMSKACSSRKENELFL